MTQIRIIHIGGPTRLLEIGGRALLPGAGTVITTVAAARRLGHAKDCAPGPPPSYGLPVGPTVTITATPARHGLALSRPIAGAVIGFLLPSRRGARQWSAILPVSGAALVNGCTG